MAALLQRMSHTGAAAPTTLSANISPTAASFTIASAAGWPTGAGGRPFVTVLDPLTPLEEKILCASITGTTVSVATGGRGWDNTAATSHNSGAVVEHVLAAVEVDDTNRHVYITGDDDHLQYFPVNASRAVTGLATFSAGITDTGPFTQNGASSLTGTLGVSGLATLGAGLNLTGNQTITAGGLTVANDITARSLAVTGLAGAVAPSRYVGATASGAPTAGTFNVGDFVIDSTSNLWVCTVAGTPGTWKSLVDVRTSQQVNATSVSLSAAVNAYQTLVSLTLAAGLWQLSAWGYINMSVGANTVTWTIRLRDASAAELARVVVSETGTFKLPWSMTWLTSLAAQHQIILEITRDNTAGTQLADQSVFSALPLRQ
jgi:hypothetical protein